MGRSKTATQILKAAEALFAEQGFSETTMRQITAAADVNLAAVNYHFGSKQGLIQAVSEQYLYPFCEYIDNAISEYLVNNPQVTVSVDDLIEMVMRALLHVRQNNSHALPMFMRLLDLAYMKNQKELRDYILLEHYTKLEVFLAQLRIDASPMEDDEFFWRLHFLLGSMVFTLSNVHTLMEIEKKEFDKEDEIEKILHRMVPVISAGFMARSDKTYFCRL
ncbi:TetR/AcrR family transcriptional regulator [Neptunomonas qingdaonensis]|uniref:Transcriptional regulator, TetR family n=1 Tax=Neptunomonas qingdaonensis TaxID=1045558 RepID=A0A1I2RWR6_9GAMM|nr:TetR/AcrR family transcriptional regulator [Neptunomonas qingdaonensis]SFG42186.1 transcriptional regulator, TetR family [Neptunomonas qingdaonensis]